MSLSLNIQKKSNSTYKYYKSIDYLPLFNFFMIHESNDLRYLLKLEDYEILPEYNTEQLQSVWENIIIEFQEADDNNNGIVQYLEIRKLHKLELEYLMLFNLRGLMIADLKGDSIKSMLKYAGFEGRNLKWIDKQIKIISNQIRIKRKNLPKQEENKHFDFYRIIDEIEDIKGRNLDIKTVTVRQYIAIKKNIKAKVKAKNGRQNIAK